MTVFRYAGGAFRFGTRTAVMGILNVTPDSFSDGGEWTDPDRALRHARRMIRDGADLVDVGGESTRPGAGAVPAAEEIRPWWKTVPEFGEAFASWHIFDPQSEEVLCDAVSADGCRALTGHADTTVRLGRYFGNSAQFWLDLQSQYDIAVV